MGWDRLSQACILIPHRHTHTITHMNLLLLYYTLLETRYPNLLEVHLIKSCLCLFLALLVQDSTIPSLLWPQILPTPEGAFIPLPLFAPSEWILPPAGRLIAPNRPSEEA